MENPKPEPLRLSVLIVNYNAGFLLTECVGRVLAGGVPLEIWVVDNASSDASMAGLREAWGRDARLRCIENPVNRGFAAANNQALVRARGEYILLLNPDCMVAPDALPALMGALDLRPDCGMAGGLLCNPDGTEQVGGRRRAPRLGTALKRVLGGRRAKAFDMAGAPLPAAAVEVEAISGAFMMIRKVALDEVGPLDEGYFMHCEDLDWCMRFRLSGWPILFVPSARAVHVKGASSVGRPVRVEYHKHRGMLRYYDKFLRARYHWPLHGLVYGAVWGRFALLAAVIEARRRFRRKGR